MIFLSLRHLLSRKRQTVLTLLGIVLGATGFVAISGFMLGFQEFLLDQLINNDAHIRISAREDRVDNSTARRDLYPQLNGMIAWIVPPSGVRSEPKIENPKGWEDLLSKDPRVEAYSLQFSAQVIFRVGALTANARLIGSEPEKQVRVTNIESYVKDGRFPELNTGGNRVFLGEGLIRKLGAANGSTVLVSSGKNTPVPFKVIGVFATGTKQLDDTTAFGYLNDVQRLADQPNEINSIAVRLLDFTRARDIASSWQSFKPDQVQSWDEINANFLNVFRIQDATRYLMIAVILIVAGFGIYNILNVVVSQKKKEIAILRAMGFEQRDIVRIFLYQGMILGIGGSLIGCGLGYLACLGLEQISFGSGPIGGASTKLKVSFDPMIYVRAFVFGSMAAILATLLPARSAGKLTPIEIIRSGAE
jgi:lipoprotein-releasing system permease protein